MKTIQKNRIIQVPTKNGYEEIDLDYLIKFNLKEIDIDPLSLHYIIKYINNCF